MKSKKKINILVLGASGFIGGHVVDYFNTISRYNVTSADLKKKYNTKNKFIKCNVLNINQLELAIKKQDYVFNFSGQADIESSNINPLETVKANILGLTNILNVCRKHKIKRVIQASTIYVNSDSGGVYKTSKLACEHLVKDYKKLFDLHYTILRFGSIYGPRANHFNFISNAIDDAINYKKITRSGKGEELREYIHVYDVAKLCSKVLEKKFEDYIVNITGTEKNKVKDILNIIKSILNENTKIKYMKNKTAESHYKITPYSHHKDIVRKIVANPFINIDEGIYDLIKLKKNHND